MENFEERIKEAMQGFETDQVTRETLLDASAIINEAWLKTIASIGIEILSKIDTSKTRKEHGDHYVNMFREQLTSSLARRNGHKS